LTIRPGVYDGTGLRRLTNNRGADFSPIWSPDGKRILFASNRDVDDELFVMEDWNPRLSPDGQTVAFTEHTLPGGPVSVGLMRADGTFLRRLTRGSEPDWRPSG
jgi:Tol biopolymer transport system component